jgi:hypothetical protein
MDWLRPLRAVRTVNFRQLLPIWSEKRDDHINAALIYHEIQILTRSDSDSKGMRLPSRKLSLNRPAWFEHGQFFFTLHGIAIRQCA